MILNQLLNNLRIINQDIAVCSEYEYEYECKLKYGGKKVRREKGWKKKEG